MGYIYKITNLFNNKSYVGLTNRSNPKHRFWEHLKPSRVKVSALSSAIIKYGKENFKFEIIEETNELEIREQFFIKELNTLSPNGYNLTTGGENPKFTEAELQRRSDFMKGRPNYNKGITQSKEWSEKRVANRRKPVIGTNKDTGEIIEFIGSTQAANYFGAKNGSLIHACASGKKATAYGYKWKYKNG